VNDEDRKLLMKQRQALLMQVDAIERRLEIEPRTADLRKKSKRVKISS
jgi:hypothetical protein